MSKLEFKGTQGVWSVTDHNWSDSSIYAKLNGVDTVVCTNSIDDGDDSDGDDEQENEMDANFNLIAAAPDLLAACIEELNSKTDPIKTRAAIAKALNISIEDTY